MVERKNKITMILLPILLCISSIFLFGVCFGFLQSQTSQDNINEEMKSNSKSVKEYYLRAEQTIMIMETGAENFMQSVLNMLQFQAEHDQYFKMTKSYLQEQNDIMRFMDLMIIDKHGNIKASANSSADSIEDLVGSSGIKSLIETFNTGQMTIVSGQSNIASLVGLEILEQTEYEFEKADHVSESEKICASTEISTEIAIENADLSNNIVVSPNSSADSSFSAASLLDTTYLYALAFNDDYAFVINDPNFTEQYYMKKMNPWRYVLEKEVIGSDGFVFVWSAENGEILYYPQDELIGADVSELGMNLEEIVDGQFVWQNVYGENLYLYPSFFPDRNAWVVCACGEKAIFGTRRQVFFSVWSIFIIFAIVLTYYEILLLKSEEVVTEIKAFSTEKENHQFHKRRVRLLIFTLFAVSCIFLSSFYLQTLYKMEDWANRSEQTVQAAEDVLAEKAEFETMYPASFKRLGTSLSKMVGVFLENNPDQIGVTTLNELNRKLTFHELKVTDSSGNVMAVSSDSGIVEYELGQSTTADEIVSGGQTEQEEIKESSLQHTAYADIALTDKEDQVFGTLRATYYTVVSDVLVSSQSIDKVLTRVQPGEGSFLFSINKDTETITYHPEKVNIGKTIQEYGIDQKYLKDGLCAVIEYKRAPYYVFTGVEGKELIFVSIKASDLQVDRLPVSIEAVIVSFVFFILIGMVLYLQKRELVHVTKEVDRSDRFGKNTPEYKAFGILFLFMIAAATVIAVYSLLNHAGKSGSVLDYVMNGNWEPGFNAFALTSSLVKICLGGMLIFLLRGMSNLLAGILPIRVATIIRMLTSLFSYLGEFFVLYLCCVDFGMPTSALMASAGVVSVVLGIGANSLVGDSIAGMFMLMEGHIQVGDTIEVDGFTGIVQELGIRVTTLYNPVDDIVKIISNKDIQNVVHRSMYPARITNLYMIEYSEDLKRVEALLQEELDKMEGQIDGLIGKPVYLGVHALGNDGVVLKVRIRGREMDRLSLQREVNRRIYLMFVENHISVPYPQITLHDAEDSSGEVQPPEMEDKKTKHKKA